MTKVFGSSVNLLQPFFRWKFKRKPTYWKICQKNLKAQQLQLKHNEKARKLINPNGKTLNDDQKKEQNKWQLKKILT